MRYPDSLSFLACVATMGLVASGCSAFATTHANPTSPLATSATGTAPTTFTVELHSEGAKTITRQVALDDPYVQQALQKSGAFKSFRRMDVEVVRITPKGTPHKMVVAFDSAKRQVEPQNNYYLFPGDKIIVTEDKSTIIDDMMRSALGPIGPKVSRKISG